jgi:hypothetical protein
MVYRFMSERRGEYTIREMAGVFGVSSSAYYKRAKRETSGVKKEGDGELIDLIRMHLIPRCLILKCYNAQFYFLSRLRLTICLFEVSADY